ncbi:hypothetical protein CB0101_00185 [Synechococcus sp. CB0101]|uniref:hypothetical protein n=1 Tax=Synechococcus sp. CB0101 TaxID=232348 RepID=UPI0002002ECC|nr:hypothetical protein [Synechococcus sp. CB0101]QCH13555.1 hypothetical protein CB0101_00185 [Synechococcus sp. CB0101]
MRITREQLQRIRRRHLGYRITLVYELVLLLLLPLAQLFPPLLSLLLIGQALVFMVFVSRFSSLKGSRPVMYALGCLAIALEVIWHLALIWTPDFVRVLTMPHVVVWVMFLLLAVVRKVRSLIREPFVTMSVVLGAASGYLTVGIAGGVMLTAMWVLQPAAFVASTLPAVGLSGDVSVAVAPALMAASFGLLTTVGTEVLTSSNVAVQVLANVITIAGQLYVAILIALILGRVQKRLT